MVILVAMGHQHVWQRWKGEGDKEISCVLLGFTHINLKLKSLSTLPCLPKKSYSPPGLEGEGGTPPGPLSPLVLIYIRHLVSISQLISGD